MAVSTTTDKFIQKFIVWIFPGILTILGYLIYGEISGLRSDVKTLLINQSALTAQVQDCRERIDKLEDKVFPSSYAPSNPVDDNRIPNKSVVLGDVVFTLPNNSYRYPKLLALSSL